MVSPRFLASSFASRIRDRLSRKFTSFVVLDFGAFATGGAEVDSVVPSVLGFNDCLIVSPLFRNDNVAHLEHIAHCFTAKGNAFQSVAVQFN